MPSFASGQRLACAIAVASLLALQACDTAEERAEEHFQSALALLEEGDASRAALEFRNVFDLDPGHTEARYAYAAMLEDEGDLPGAFDQYRIIAERFPEEAQPRFELARIAIQSQEWDEARRHGERLASVEPESERARAISAILRYQDAVDAEDPSARREAAAEVEAASEGLSGTNLVDGIRIDNLLREQDYTGALAIADRVVAEEPTNERYQQLRLQLLGRLQDELEIRAQLERMVELFPESDAYAATLIQYLRSRGDVAGAEAFIREQIAAKDGEEADANRALLLRFLQQTDGADAAIAEAETFIEEAADPRLFRSLKAGLLFDAGQQEAAIADMKQVVDGAEDTEQVRNFRIALARMQTSIGNEDEARAIVDDVLAQDPTHVDANKLRAAWLIEEDKPEDAIVALRQALDQAPNDAQIMSLMAEAHLRNGSRGLAGELLALAVDASGDAEAESLAYAEFLVQDGNLAAAENVLVDALRAAPDTVSILSALGRIYIAQEDWPRTQQVEDTLSRAGAETEASSLQVARLRGQGRNEEALAFLEDIARDAGAAGPADVAIVRQRVSAGDVDGARSYVDAQLRDEPGNRLLRVLKAAVLQAQEDWSGAEAIYRDILDEEPKLESVWRALYTLRLRQGDQDGARAVLDDAVAEIPDGVNLLWALAGELERSGEIDEAIAIYEDLYERLPQSAIVANNLASLLATYREDDESLERAFAISRRLRGMDVPAFQDTYGWIAQRRGQTDVAIEHLEPAAAGLPNDPIVQYHLAVAYAAAGRNEEALAQFRRALDIAGPADSRPQLEIAKSEIERLKTAASAGSAAAPAID